MHGSSRVLHVTQDSRSLWYPYCSLVPSLFSLARGGKESGEVPIRSVNDDVMLVVCDVFNVAIDLMFARWQVNEADCLSFHYHT